MSDVMAKIPAIPKQPPTSTSLWPSILALAVGVFLLGVVFLVEHLGLNFHYNRLLTYSAVAALFAGIGSTAAVHFGWESGGQAGAAGGAAALAIILAWTIGNDPPPRVSMTYYINFPDADVQRLPGHFKATVEVIRSGETVPAEKREVQMLRSPGGNALKVPVHNVSSNDSIIVRLRSTKENKTWASAALPSTESFMNVNEE